MPGLITTEQCKKIVSNYMSHRGQGGFMTGVVTSIAPLSVQVEDRLTITEESLYVTDSCIGLVLHPRHTHGGQPEDLKEDVILREPLKAGDAVLLICRPGQNDNGERYILLDKIQPYEEKREVDAR